MKIAFIIPGGVDRSGRERVLPYLLWLIERLARRHTVHVFMLNHYAEPCEFELLGASVHNIGNAPGPRVVKPVQQWNQLISALRAAAPFDVLHAFWGTPTGTLAALAGRMLKVPSVVTLIGGEFVGLAEIGYGAQLSLRSRLELWLTLRFATRLTAQTYYMSSLAKAHGVTVEVVPIGVDGHLFKPAPFTRHALPLRLLHVASLNRVKDQDTLLRAFKHVTLEVPQTHLDIIGEDVLHGAVQARCAQLELNGQVSFYGFKPSDELPPFYQNAHVFVLTSRHEAGPLVVLEAAMCGLPTVGTNVGYAADWHPDRAIAVPIGDNAALAKGILDLLNDPARREAMGRAAQSWARVHDADWTATQFERMYHELERS